jgi:hypothetical protein
MSSDVPFSAVREMLEAVWTGAPMVWPNEGLEVSDSSMPWVYCEMTGDSMEAMELGGASAAWVESGLVWIHIHAPTGTGTLEIRAIARQLSDIFRAAVIPGITFGRQSLGAGEQGDDDGLYWRQSFTVEYEYQSILAAGE